MEKLKIKTGIPRRNDTITKPYNKEETLYWYSVATALKLVHNLSKVGADVSTYDAAAQIPGCRQ